jgi:small subunit ribosomal protein S16
MLKIRLSRAGKRNMAFFKVVLTEHTKAAKHGYKEVLGFYNPITKEFKIKSLDKVKTYISN